MNKKSHILIVEDDSLIYMEVVDLLIRNGFLTDEYTPSYLSAIERVEKKLPELAIIDIKLKGNQNGLELGNRLVKEYRIPVIYLTALIDEFTFQESLYNNPSDFILKSELNNSHRLIRAIKRILYGNRTFDGIYGLLSYRENVREMGKGLIGSVPVNYENIAFFTTDIFLNQNNELEKLKPNYLWFQDMTGETYFLYQSLRRLEEILPHYFARVNGKYIVNLANKNMKVFLGKTQLTIMKKDIIITETYKRIVKSKLKSSNQF